MINQNSDGVLQECEGFKEGDFIVVAGEHAVPDAVIEDALILRPGILCVVDVLPQEAELHLVSLVAWIMREELEREPDLC